MNSFSKEKISFLVNDEIINLWQFKIIKNLIDKNKFEFDKIYYIRNRDEFKRPSFYKLIHKILIDILYFNADYLQKINTEQIFLLSKNQKVTMSGLLDIEQLGDELSQSRPDLLINLSQHQVPPDYTSHMKLGQTFFVFGNSRFINLHYSVYKNLKQILIEHVWINKNHSYVFSRGYAQKKYYSASETVSGCGFMTEDWNHPTFNSSVENKPFWSNDNEYFRSDSDQGYGWSLILLFVFNIVLARSKQFFMRLRRAFTYQKWNIMLAAVNVKDMTTQGSDFLIKRKSLFKAEWPMSYADPFCSIIGDKKCILYEDFNFKKNAGQISIAVLDEKNHFKESKVLLSNDTHFSYPCVFKNQDSVYVIPENIQSEKVIAYRIDPESLTIIDQTVLIEGDQFVDPTLYFSGGYFWIFCSKWNNYDHGSGKLYLYFSDRFEGPYTPHPLNPIVADLSSARPAGSLFEVDGKLFRPSQDCLLRYGHKINISHIEKFSTTEYQEKIVQEIRPDAEYPISCHHISLAGDILILDGQQEIFTFKIFYWKFKKFILTKLN